MNLIIFAVIICASIVLMEIIYCIKEYLVSRERWCKKFDVTLEELKNDFRWLELESNNMLNEVNKLISYLEKIKEKMQETGNVQSEMKGGEK